MSFIDARIHTHTPTPSRSPLPLPIVLHLAEVHTCVLPLLFYFSLPYTLRLVIPTAGIYQVYIRLTRQKSTQTHTSASIPSVKLSTFMAQTHALHHSACCVLCCLFSRRGANVVRRACSRGEPLPMLQAGGYRQGGGCWLGFPAACQETEHYYSYLSYCAFPNTIFFFCASHNPSLLWFFFILTQ